MDSQSTFAPDRHRTDLDRLPQLPSSTLIRQTPPQFDGEIERLLEQIGDAFGADHRSLEALAQDDHRQWPPDVLERMRRLAEMLAAGVDRRRHADVTRATAAAPRPRADAEVQPAGSGATSDFEDIIGDSPLLRAALARVQEVAATSATVVLVGETGTGKELFARAVHERSPRRGRPFVRVNCAALPATLIESELFGHERGAFTGAISMRQGRFELAHKGTIFLDEIGDLPLDVQAKLLRVLQENEFERVGSSQTRKVDVRIVAATHHDLEAAVAEGRFRADLFYRLSVYPISLPPLRARAEDVPRLVWHFITKRQHALNARITRVPAPVMAALQQYSWPGNVRELENVIERAMIHSHGDTLLLDGGLGGRPGRPGVTAIAGGSASLEDVERRHIEDTLRRCAWRINGASNAAEQLGLHPNTLRFRMTKLGIRRPAGPVAVHQPRRAQA